MELDSGRVMEAWQPHASVGSHELLKIRFSISFSRSTNTMFSIQAPHYIPKTATVRPINDHFGEI
jgi:hypothetical protein